MRFAKIRVGGVFLAVAGLAALSACSSSSGTSSGTPSSIGLAGQYGSVPAETGTVHTGVFKVAMPPNSAPTWILPIVTAAANSVYNDYMFDYEMYRPLYWLYNGVEPTETPSMSLASDPVWSNGDKTVSVTLKSTYKWSDGQPITSKDVLFWYDELKAALKESPANWAVYTPGLGLPDEVASVSTPSASTIVFNLTKAVNPTWFWEDELGTIQPMPSHAWAKASATGPILDFTNPANATKIYNFLSAQSKSVATYATNPLWQVVDGAYKLTSFNTTTGAFSMAYNTAYDGPHVSKVSNWESVPFTSDTAEFNAVKAGTLDVGYVPLTDVPQVSSVKSSYDVFGYPDFGFSYVAYNFKDTTGDFNNLIDKLYIRQAIAHLENEAGYVKAFFYGAGGPGYGPVPSIPKSPYTPANALTDPYPFSTTDAANLLKANGWNVVPNGTDTCQKAGTGAGECGAGIPAGTKLEWNLIANTSPAIIDEQCTDLASEAKTVGMTMNLSTSNFNYMIQNYNDPAAPKTINKWAMEDFGGFSISTYPTTFGIFNTTGSSNIGGYTDPQADKLITASISSSNPDAVTAEASYLTTQQPGLFQPNPDSAFTSGVITISKSMTGNTASLQSLSEFQVTPEQWYFTK
jgi:peptide/nickel transport system substrate-binding protein